MKSSIVICSFVVFGCSSPDGGEPVHRDELSADASANANANLDQVPTGSTCGATSDTATRAFAPAAGTPGSSAIEKDDPRIVAWASRVLDIDYGDSVKEDWKRPERALGPAEGTSTEVVSLGEGGAITLGFDAPITDSSGSDICVFENSFSDDFLELGFVEVASNEDVFVRFDVYSRVPAPVAAYDTIEPTLLDGFAGKYRQGTCTPFDLAILKDRPEVVAGLVDLNSIRFVRIRDVAGDGREFDCASAPIYDPYPTTGGAGFDLDGIAVLGPDE